LTIKRLNKELLELTSPYVGRTDQVQGPGGNTSVKGTDRQMMIKASGYRFEEITDVSGFSMVNYENIRNYFHEADIGDKTSREQDSLELVMNNIQRDQSGSFFPKPSMETGFHAVLDKYVIHTHSVWSNLVNCNSSNPELLEKLRSLIEIPFAVIPYISPGFGLSYMITQEILAAKKRNQRSPGVFFLTNHGIIAHGDDPVEVHAYLRNMDEAVRSLFPGSNDYPGTGLIGNDLNEFVPSDGFVNSMLGNYNAANSFFEHVLFPDQAVFFRDNISYDEKDSGKKIRITKDFRVSYHANKREASSIHETMTAYLYIYDTILRSGQKPSFISMEEQEYISGMAMEKHRKSLME
jgi:ribulose-5-phosphate 4-epimerase/fuculose-1-phosphate aldolase